MSSPTDRRPYPNHGRELESDQLRALAHPLRVRILDELSMYGPLTATGLGERLAESSGATSYHLRQLEKHGLVREDTAKGNARERWWERMPGAFSVGDPNNYPPGSAERLASRLINDEFLRSREATFREFLAQDEEAVAPEWSRLAVADTVNLRLTADQMQGLVQEIDDVLDRYLKAYKATPSEGSRPMQLQLNVFPLARGE